MAPNRRIESAHREEKSVTLQEWIDRVAADPSRALEADLLRIAQQLAANGVSGDDFERARRGIPVTPEAIRALADESTELRDGRDFVAVYLILLAATVGQGDVLLRTLVAGRLGEVALQMGIPDMARDAFVDARESVAILDRFFQGDPERIAAWEKDLEEKMDALRPPDVAKPVFEYPHPDTVAAWMNMIAWNLDFDPQAGMLGQGDAALRLARRFVAYGDTDPEGMAPAVRQLVANCAAMPDEPRGARARCLMTIGNALYEADEWLLGARIHAQALQIMGDESRDPYGVHFAVQQAMGLAMAEADEDAQACLNAVDAEALTVNAELLLPSAADAARYTAVQERLRRRRGEPADESVDAMIQSTLQRVATLASRSSDRPAYLGNLFVGMLARDVAILLEPPVSV